MSWLRGPFQIFHVPLARSGEATRGNLILFLIRVKLFSFPFSAEEHDLEDEREGSDVSLKIASVLPGLRYALQKATSSPRGDALSTDVRIKQHFQEYAKLEQNAQHASGPNDDIPRPSHLPPAEDERIKSSEKRSEQSFSQLQHYLSDPSSYTLEMSAALGCLAGAVQSLCCSSEAAREADCPLAPPPDPVPPDVPAEVKLKGENPKPTAAGPGWSGEGPPKDVSSASELWMQQNKRKSSQAAVTGAGKKWSPLKMQMHPVGDSSRDRKATKRKIAFSFPQKPGLMASSNEPMLKLANLEFPHRRKRGKCCVIGTGFLLLLQGSLLGYRGFLRKLPEGQLSGLGPRWNDKRETDPARSALLGAAAWPELFAQGVPGWGISCPRKAPLSLHRGWAKPVLRSQPRSPPDPRRRSERVEVNPKPGATCAEAASRPALSPGAYARHEWRWQLWRRVGDARGARGSWAEGSSDPQAPGICPALLLVTLPVELREVLGEVNKYPRGAGVPGRNWSGLSLKIARSRSGKRVSNEPKKRCLVLISAF